jgi:hypothetical protein
VKVRKPKSEIRRKAEDRRPKDEDRGVCGTWPFAEVATRQGTDRWRCLFGFRTSGFLRLSVFGFRFLIAAISRLAARPLFAAATNTPANDEIPPLRPPHAEIPATFWDQYGVWVILAGILVMALVGAAIWFFTRPKPPAVVPVEVLARKALEPLRLQPEDGALLSRVSQVLRHYVAAAFNLPPGELTTAEFCGAMAGHPLIGPELSAALGAFLRLCDQDKFSPPAPVPPLSAVAQALKLIDQAQARRLALAQSAGQPAQRPVAIPPKTGTEK